MNFRQFFSAAYWLMLVAFGLTSATFFLQTYSEYKQLQATEAANARRTAELQARLAERETVLARLSADKGFVEKKIRQNLSYAKPGEYIFRFEE